MLVFISDLHFADGTAGEHNLSSQAFEYFFDDLAAIANKPSNKIKEINCLFGRHLRSAADREVVRLPCG